ncbi:Acetyltransferase (GNAT) family protein [Bacillus toyonensis]|nr:Acetyltransferase (GNAT) family protein [Bacillus toyonensis]SLK15189.1 Acetyltransferase (GNAT) family protein [Bacillus toyonensis]
MLNVRKGTMDLLEGLDRMYTECKKALLQNQIYQWDDSYPAREHISYHLEQDELYCLFEDDSLVGAVVLNEWQSPEYKRIDWSETDGRFLIVHSFVIHPLSQGKGYSKVLLSFWESEARRKGYNGIRLDCFTRNPVSLSLYEKTIIFAEVLFILKVNSLLTTGIIAMKKSSYNRKRIFLFLHFS